MNAIKKSVMYSVKTQILTDTNFSNDFSQCVTLNKDYIVQTNMNKNPEVNISAMVTTDKDTGDRKHKVEDPYYTTKEYHALSQE